MDKYIERAMKDWAKAEGLTHANECKMFVGTSRLTGYEHFHRDSNMFPDGTCETTIILNLDWWREVPIGKNAYGKRKYFAELAKLVGIPSPIKKASYNYNQLILLHNATIAQRCEAKYKAEVTDESNV